MNPAIESPSSGAQFLINILQLRKRETKIFKRDWQNMVPINPSWTTVCGVFSCHVSVQVRTSQLTLKLLLVLGFLDDADALFLSQKPSHPISTTPDSSKDSQGTLLWPNSWKTGSQEERTLSAPAWRKAGARIRSLLVTGVLDREISLKPPSQPPGIPSLLLPWFVSFPCRQCGTEVFLRHFSGRNCERSSLVYSSLFHADVLLARKNANDNSLTLLGLNWD